MDKTPTNIIAVETRGRKPIDGRRRTERIQLRMTPEDVALIDAARGDLSRNEFIIRAVRLGVQNWSDLRAGA